MSRFLIYQGRQTELVFPAIEQHQTKGRLHNEQEISSGICADRLHIDIRHPEIHRYTCFNANGPFTPAIYYTIACTIARIVAQPILEPNHVRNRSSVTRKYEAVADLRGGREGRAPPPLGAQILSISCSFWKIWQNRMLAPPPRGVGTPSSGKSWIRHCEVYSNRNHNCKNGFTAHS